MPRPRTRQSSTVPRRRLADAAWARAAKWSAAVIAAGSIGYTLNAVLAGPVAIARLEEHVRQLRGQVEEMNVSLRATLPAVGHHEERLKRVEAFIDVGGRCTDRDCEELRQRLLALERKAGND